MSKTSGHAVWLVEPNQILAEGLAHFLETGPFAVARRWGSVQEALEADGGAVSPEVILMDASNGPLPNCAEVEGLRGQHRGVRIALLVDRIENPSIYGPEALDVDGVLLESAAPAAMIKSLELLALGERFFPVPLPAPGPALIDGAQAAPLDRRIARPREPILLSEACDRHRLTERERQVLEALARGAPNKSIARQLDISEATVKVHVKSILRKTGARNRTEAALWAHGAQADPVEA